MKNTKKIFVLHSAQRTTVQKALVLARESSKKDLDLPRVLLWQTVLNHQKDWPNAPDDYLRHPSNRFDIKTLSKEERDVLNECSLVIVPHLHTERSGTEYQNIDEILSEWPNLPRLDVYSDGSFDYIPASGLNDYYRRRFIGHQDYEARKRRQAKEIAEFTNELIEDVLKRMERAEEEGFERWRKAAPKTPHEVLDFYKTADFYIYQLMKSNYYQGGRSFLTEDVLTACGNEKKQNVLEIGPGVGALALVLAQSGHALTLCDVPGPLFEFVKFRFRKRSLPVQCISSKSDAPLEGHPCYDLILATDVLEHLADPFSALKHWADHLANDGRLLVRMFLLDEEAAKNENPVPLHFNILHKGNFESCASSAGLQIKSGPSPFWELVKA